MTPWDPTAEWQHTAGPLVTAVTVTGDPMVPARRLYVGGCRADAVAVAVWHAHRTGEVVRVEGGEP